MMRNPCTAQRGCCFEACGSQLNPLAVKNTVPAGSVCAETAAETNCLLAMAYMPDERYQAGYCPEETLAAGTFFPELVRPYC